jgi:hypothetical protein
MSRLYNNTYQFDDFVQNFKFSATGCSIGAFLVSDFYRSQDLVNVFTGTSFAVYEELKLFSIVQRKRIRQTKNSYLPLKTCVLNGKAALWNSAMNPSSRVL